jgi:cation transport ATPase
MLTGDNATTAATVAERVGVDEVISDVLPADKEMHVRQLQMRGRKIAMIGDGINDAPALTRADVGIAIGAGTDIAMESADVVLMKNSLADAVTAMELSRKVLKNIRMNLFWAFFYNVLGIPVAAGLLFLPFGIKLSPMIGSAAMSLSSVFVVTNALRLRLFRPRAVAQKSPETHHDDVDNNREKEIKEMKAVLKIDGMMCNHCRMHVEKALSAVEGVTAVTVDLEAKTATVEMATEIDREVLRAVVADAGYTPLD